MRQVFFIKSLSSLNNSVVTTLLFNITYIIRQYSETKLNKTSFFNLVNCFENVKGVNYGRS